MTRYETLKNKPKRFLSLTGYTLEEFSALAPYFSWPPAFFESNIESDTRFLFELEKIYRDLAGVIAELSVANPYSKSSSIIPRENSAAWRSAEGTRSHLIRETSALPTVAVQGRGRGGLCIKRLLPNCLWWWLVGRLWWWL